jgi:hypothetical protein
MGLDRACLVMSGHSAARTARLIYISVTACGTVIPVTLAAATMLPLSLFCDFPPGTKVAG